MKPLNHSNVSHLLTDDILVCIFDKTSILQRKRLSRVCKRWKNLIDITFLWVTRFSAVDARRCVPLWQPTNWLSLHHVSKCDYIRHPKASEVLARLAVCLPNLREIDIECGDLSNRIFRTILSSCKRVERINLDSSTRLNHYSFNLLVRDWTFLRHVNLSCCTEFGENSAKLLITSLKNLESLNMCGTTINGDCLENLNSKMKRLNISYCWSVQEAGLLALSRAQCRNLIELSVNNFDFDRSELCMIALLDNFKELQHLEMSIGPCIGHDYFIDRITCRGFSKVAQLKNLETLIIEKICILDNASLLKILRGCPKLKHFKLNLKWLNFCNDLSFSHLGAALSNLNELHIHYPSEFTMTSALGLYGLQRLKSLSLVDTNIDNDIFKFIEGLECLTKINFDDCRKITLKGLNHLCRIAFKRGNAKIHASLLGTGIIVSRTKNRKNFPSNLIAQLSHFRATKYHMQLPPPAVIDM